MNSHYYFNPKALLHMLLIVVLCVFVDGGIIDYGNDVNAFSKGFYSKLALCILYLIASKEKSVTSVEHNSIDAAFHFSVLILCLWMGIACFMLDNVEASRIFGIFIIFGGLSAFNLIDESLKIARLKMQSNMIGLYAIESILKIFLFSIFCLAAFFLLMGQWQWDIKPFYEW